MIAQIACLLSPEMPPIKAVEEAVAILKEARLIARGKDGFYHRAQLAASIPGDLSVSERFERVAAIFKEACECFTSNGRRPDGFPTANSREHYAEMAKLNETDFTDRMETRKFLKLVLPKKKTYEDRLRVYRNFLAEKDRLLIDPFSMHEEIVPENIQVAEIFTGRGRAILSEAAIFLLWLPGYEQKVRTKRASKGGIGKAAKCDESN